MNRSLKILLISNNNFFKINHEFISLNNYFDNKIYFFLKVQIFKF